LILRAGEVRSLLTNISKIRIIILLDIPVLKPADFHILLALAGGPLHGYRIMKDVERDTGGEVTLEIGSLYRLLARLVTEGLIDDIEGADERRRYYCITAAGRRALKTEAARLANVVTLVRARKLLPETDL
jgi:DNA-binding PadR family transcriptional regulator